MVSTIGKTVDEVLSVVFINEMVPALPFRPGQGLFVWNAFFSPAQMALLIFHFFLHTCALLFCLSPILSVDGVRIL